MKLNTLVENSAIAMHTLHEKIEEVARKAVALSETSHGIERFGKVPSYLDGAA